MIEIINVYFDPKDKETIEKLPNFFNACFYESAYDAMPHELGKLYFPREELYMRFIYRVRDDDKSS